MSSTADLPSYRHRMADEGHEALRQPLAAAIDDLAAAVALLAENQAGVQDAYFFSDLLLQMMGETMGSLATVVYRRDLLAARAVPLPMLAVGNSELTVSWGTNLGDASYQVEFADNPGLLGKVTPTVKTTYATSCVLTLKTSVAIPLGALLELTAVRYA